MALVKQNNDVVSWNIKAIKKPRVKLPEIKDRPVLDYEKLRWLCQVNDSTDRKNEESKNEFHELFMENYKKLFVQPPKKIGFPDHSVKRGNKNQSLHSLSQKATGPTTESEKKAILPPTSDTTYTHNIGDYLKTYHKQRRTDKPKTFNPDSMKILRKLLRKLPFERSATEIDKMRSILKTIPFFADNIPDSVIKELCVVAQLEVWKESDFNIFGNIGLHVILKGCVQPETNQYLIVPVNKEKSMLTSTNVSTNISITFSSDTTDTNKQHTEDKQPKKLGVGDCFGTLKKLEDEEPTCRSLTVKTLETNCEFMKITTSDYKRVMEQIKQKEHTEKLNLILSCSQYNSWPRQPLLQISNLIEWITYKPNTVLVSEGYKSPFIAFIKSGECHVLRQVEVLETLKNGQKEHKSKQVVIGRLGPSTSFCELSVLLKEPMSTSIVTASNIELGIIKPERLEELDEVTIQLFKQSNTHLFGNLTKDDVHEEYMQQELKREWNEFKHHVVVDVINTRGIKPGYGKWAK
ncbi:hypothetical protein LOTGIDRAFT_231321 [Lottia gigantea]|uniref:Cyclic nucleotide-binding domain-containing protein n=1 Tax=Lottia gigantea TaxID=225164 RepID=V4AXA2_LOTGI|nr:hypothetical protein LOTGIDRAFT_231321 [Lottia gigantea]ESO98196.1 hypothetical protein LOTGIDRAFT_231321 [Lottia gigantea]